MKADGSNHRCDFSSHPHVPPTNHSSTHQLPFRNTNFLKDWARILLRSLGFQILSIRSHGADCEVPKVAIHKCRGKALLRMSVHLAPLLASIALVAINWRSTYILHDSPWFAALPFVSKLHEILMQASIAAMLATCIRRELLRDGLPLGGLFAIVQAANPAYLWSIEFWGSMRRLKWRSRKTWRIVRYATIVTLSVLLASGVGPASNIAIVPREGRFVIGANRLRVNSMAIDLYPMRLDAQNIVRNTCDALATGDGSLELNRCQPNDFDAADNLRQVLDDDTLPYEREGLVGLGGDSRAQRELRAFVKGSRFSTGQDLSIATTIPATTANYLTQAMTDFDTYVHRFREFPNPDIVDFTSSYRLNKRFQDIRAEHVIDSQVPFVSTVCTIPQLFNEPPSLSQTPGPVSLDSSARLMFKTFDNGTFGSQLELIELQSLAAQNASRVIWLAAPPEYSRDFSVTGVIIAPYIVAACSIKVAWGTVSMNMTSESHDVAVTGVTKPTINFSPFADGRWKAPATWPAPSISISPKWMEQILPSNASSDLSISTGIKTSLTLPALIDRFLNVTALDHRKYPELYLSSLVAAGMSRIHPDSASDFALDTWYTREPWAEQDAAKEYPTGSFETTTKTYLIGRGYYFDEIPTYLAIAILMIYCFFVLTHILYTVLTGVSSNSWDSVAEITALALNSRTPSGLQHGSAGIANMRTFSQPVGIRTRKADGEERIELVFIQEEEKDNSGLGRLAKNTKY